MQVSWERYWKEMIQFCFVLIFRKMGIWGITIGCCRSEQMGEVWKSDLREWGKELTRTWKISLFLEFFLGRKSPEEKKIKDKHGEGTKDQRNRNRLSWREGYWEQRKGRQMRCMKELTLGRHGSSPLFLPILHYIWTDWCPDYHSSPRLQTGKQLALCTSNRQESIVLKGQAVKSQAWPCSHQTALCNPLHEDLWGKMQREQLSRTLYLIWYVCVCVCVCFILLT